jgi:hypothetical protein
VNWKSIGLHAAVVLVAWFVGSGFFGLIPDIIAPRTLPVDSPLLHKATIAYELFGIWVVYRVGSRLFKFPGPKGTMFMLVRLAWCFFAFTTAGGTVELLVGYPTFAAGLAGLVLAIVVFFLPRPPKSLPESSS